MNRSRLVLLLVVAGALGAGGAALSCNLMDAVTCDRDELDLAAGTWGDFGSDADSQKIEAFFAATVAVNTKAHDLATRLTTACTNIGTALGLTPTDMQPTGTDPSDADRITAACTRVATEIRATLAAALPSGAKLSIVFQPPVCEANFDAYASCAAACNVTVVPGELDVDCEPGSMGIGQCSAGCSGECWVDASAACVGSCSAQCTGTCSGACHGTCAGTCDYESSPGVCAGNCVGTCTGSCSATCDGACSGTCRFDASAGCTGECHGSCDVWVTPPHCDVYARPPQVDANCHASCEARASASLTCTPGSLNVDYGLLAGDPAAQAKLQALVTALRANLPDVLRAAKETVGAVVDLVESFFAALDGFAGSLAATLDAAMCAVVALSVNVQVTATFTVAGSASLDIVGAVGIPETEL
jgi:hypothetical protein